MISLEPIQHLLAFLICFLYRYSFWPLWTELGSTLIEIKKIISLVFTIYDECRACCLDDVLWLLRFALKSTLHYGKNSLQKWQVSCHNFLSTMCKICHYVTSPSPIVLFWYLHCWNLTTKIVKSFLDLWSKIEQIWQLLFLTHICVLIFYIPSFLKYVKNVIKKVLM